MKVILQDLTKIFESRQQKGKEVVAVNKFNYEIPDGKQQYIIVGNFITITIQRRGYNRAFFLTDNT